MGYETRVDIDFPKRFLTEEVKEIMKGELTDKRTFTFQENEGVISFGDYDVKHGEFVELESYFRKNVIPFDRYAEDEDGGTFRYSYRPNEYDGKVQVSEENLEPMIPAYLIEEIITEQVNPLFEAETMRAKIKNLLKKFNPNLKPLESYN